MLQESIYLDDGMEYVQGGPPSPYPSRAPAPHPPALAKYHLYNDPLEFADIDQIAISVSPKTCTSVWFFKTQKFLNSIDPFRWPKRTKRHSPIWCVSWWASAAPTSRKHARFSGGLPWKIWTPCTSMTTWGATPRWASCGASSTAPRATTCSSRDSAVMQDCIASWSRGTASRRVISLEWDLRTAGSGIVGTPCTWRARGDSCSAIGGPGIWSMPRSPSTRVSWRTKPTASGDCF